VPAEAQIQALAQQAGQALLGAGLRAVTAESCTGGGIASALTDVPGSSGWFERGYVTYSNSAKQQDLGVAAQLIADQGHLRFELSALPVRQYRDFVGQGHCLIGVIERPRSKV